MRTSRPAFAKILVICCFVALSANAVAAVNGAIQTTNSTGTKVNGNLYPAKTAVYLNGGPQNTSDPGLTPGQGATPALYVFQVTNPSGTQLLSADDISCRQVLVENGRIIGTPSAQESPYGTVPSSQSSGCDHPLGIVSPGSLPANNQEPVQLCPSASRTSDNLNNGQFYDPNNWCDTSSNPGGEYKVWLTPEADYVGPTGSCPTGNNVWGFCDSESKTDNFKVQPPPPPPPCDPNTDPNCQGPPPPSATLVACKYWDKDDDGFNEGPDTLLTGWTITATPDASNADSLVINGGAPGAAASGQTDSTGCTTFTVTGFALSTSSDSVTVTETQQTNWNQVAPLASNSGTTYSGGSGGNITAFGNCTADPKTGLVAPCSSYSDVPLLGDGSTTTAPDFGNTGLDLTVTKNATPSFTREYEWNIVKCAKDPNSTNCVSNPTKVDQNGGTVTFNYSVVASETGFQDSAWTVKGSVTVTNPNSFEVDGVTISENGSGKSLSGESCGFDNQTLPPGASNNGTTISGINLAAGGSLSATYTCSYTSNPGAGTNDATATWSDSTYHTPDNSADSGSSGAYDFSSVAPTTLNKTVTVTDCFNGCLVNNVKTPTTLGTVTAVDTCTGLSPVCSSKTFTYSHTVSVPRFGCATFPNTAVVVLSDHSLQSTDPSASASVGACGPEQTGALTMGFWQNKNGQGIIANGASTGGICNSGTWLRQFAPFQDLSSTATCKQVASYVAGVIGAATCGGSTCNAMLKAQMLATALDVFFSDPALGGNKISAPSAIGGDSIDLTKICAMIDGSGGGSCSGKFENVSSAFGGATSLTVYQMLVYAAGQSNVGGSLWYGNVKATQVLAKDAFDAINNQVAFAP